MATGVVSALLDVDEGDLTIHLTYELPAEVAALWREAEALRAQAERSAGSRCAALLPTRGGSGPPHSDSHEPGRGRRRARPVEAPRVQQLAS